MPAWSAVAAKPAYRRIRDVLGHLPLLTGENIAAYKALHTQVIKAIAPTDAIEEIWAGDLADLTWESYRGRRLKAEIVDACAHEGLTLSLEPILSETKRSVLIQGWAKGDAKSRRRVTSTLKRASKNDGSVLAMTQLIRLDALERIDRLIALAERRRILILREIERYRQAASERRRRFRLEIDTLDFVDQRRSKHTAL